MYPEATEAFLSVKDNPFLTFDINNPVFDVLQRFEVILYDRASLATDVNTSRQQQQHFIHSCTAYIHLNMEKELN